MVSAKIVALGGASCVLVATGAIYAAVSAGSSGAGGDVCTHVPAENECAVAWCEGFMTVLDEAGLSVTDDIPCSVAHAGSDGEFSFTEIVEAVASGAADDFNTEIASHCGGDRRLRSEATASALDSEMEESLNSLVNMGESTDEGRQLGRRRRRRRRWWHSHRPHSHWDGTNYGCCSTDVGFMVGARKDTADCAKSKDKYKKLQNGHALSDKCCYKHDKCLTNVMEEAKKKGRSKDGTGSCKKMGDCDWDLSQCATILNCNYFSWDYRTCCFVAQLTWAAMMAEPNSSEAKGCYN